MSNYHNVSPLGPSHFYSFTSITQVPAITNNIQTNTSYSNYQTILLATQLLTTVSKPTFVNSSDPFRNRFNHSMVLMKTIHLSYTFSRTTTYNFS